MNSDTSISDRQRSHAPSNRLQQAAAWVKLQHQLRTATAAHQNSDSTTGTNVGAAWQQPLRNFRRNTSFRKSSSAEEDSVGERERSFHPRSLFADISDNVRKDRNPSKQVDLLTAEGNLSTGESTVHRLTPDKKRLRLPQRTTQIALNVTYKRSESIRRRGNINSVSTSIFLWIDAARELILSPAMANMLHCSADVGYQLVVLVLYTAALPVTLPLQLCTSTIQIARDTAHRVLQNASQLALQATSPSRRSGQSSGERSDENHESQGLFRGILSIPGAVICIAGNVVLSLVAPVLLGSSDDGDKCKEEPPFTSPQRPSNHDGYLDRLRLDYTGKQVGSAPLVSSKQVMPVVKISSSLLRVNDVHVRSPESECAIFYVDLIPPKEMDDPPPIVNCALDELVAGALRLLSNHPICKIDSTLATDPQSEIDWHPEGATQRLLRQDNNDSAAQFRDVLLWSGRFREMKGGHGRHHGFFLARGNIPMAPYAFAQLLWDNSRTSEYNHFCLGRVTLHSVGAIPEQAILDGTADAATKVIRSEMRVPIAGLTVTAICLMHIRPLIDGSGYVMVSRTLDSGPAGVHYEALSGIHKIQGKHEILWGCNVIRSVPNQPDVAELTSLSQVGSSVPSFVAHKIGIMGVADFFKNVRAVAVASCS
jgi:hypothetical protein